MKVRLVKGPFGGKVYDVPANETIIIRDKKRMTREQQYNYQVEQYQKHGPHVGYGYPRGRMPLVEATYRRAVRPHYVGHNVAMITCQHPDGSIFYEWTGDKRDYEF